VKASNPRPRTGLRHPRTLAASLAALVVAGGLGWYAVDHQYPAQSTSAPAVWCDQHLKAAGLDPAQHHLTLFTSSHGEAMAEILSAGFNLKLCVTDGHGAGVTDTVDPAPGGPVTLPRQTVVLDTSGAFGTGAVTAYATGFTGADVQSITVTTNGHTTPATIHDGRWLAWWPVANKTAAKDATVTITYANGSSASGPLDKVTPYAA
jgi:homoaconitase/3-isopropylmalate dehydratase large subunit